MTIPEAWSIAGITDSDGEMDRVLPVSGWLSPVSVRLDVRHFDPVLISEERTRPRKDDLQEFRRSANGKMLEGFVSLVNQPVERIRDYARYWGMLKRDWQKGDAEIIEPIELWLRLSYTARMALSLSTWLRTGGPLPEEERRYLRSRWGPPLQDQYLTEQAAKSCISGVINGWLTEAKIAPMVAYRMFDGRYPDFILRARSLHGGLALQLAMAVSASEGFVLCSACGVPYLPTRRPRAGQNCYCDRCRENGAPERNASKAYRRREVTKHTR